MRSLIAAALIVGIVLLVLLFNASSTSGAFSDILPSLFIGGGVLGIALLVLLGWRLWWLQKRIRRGVFGAKLTLKLLLMFGVVAAAAWCVWRLGVLFLNCSDRNLARRAGGQHHSPASTSAMPRSTTCCANSIKKRSAWR
jgi:nitrogen fixation/metabolism regulation signal transduction histidine kinase